MLCFDTNRILVLIFVVCKLVSPLVTTKGIKHDGNQQVQVSDYPKVQNERAKVWYMYVIGGYLLCKIFCDKRGHEGHSERDNEAPDVTCPLQPASIVYTVEGKDKIVLNWNIAHASDNAGIRPGSLIQTSPSWRSGSEFEAGDYRISYRAKDVYGNIGSCERDFTVKVRKCHNPQHPANGKVVCPRLPPIFGDSCEYSCNEGYLPDGQEPSIQKCKANGNYEGHGYTCKAKTCGIPIAPDNAEINMITDCTNYDRYNSKCRFRCKPGYSSSGVMMPHIQCNKDSTWSSTTLLCKDATPPVITTCPKSFDVYVNEKQVAIVNYQIPSAFDKNDGPFNATLFKGLRVNEEVTLDRLNPSNNVYTIEYTAVNRNGHWVERPCVFHVSVKELLCPMLEYREKLSIDCSSPLAYGAKCSFECNSGHRLIGPEEINCEVVKTDPPTADWNWGGENQTYCRIIDCPDLYTPNNGAMSCVLLQNGKFCQMSCNADYDIPSSSKDISGEYYCDDSKGWLTDASDKIPDCSRRRYSWEAKLLGELHYFTGDCTDTSTKQQIKEKFMKIVTDAKVPGNCTTFPDCSIKNVEVSCGKRTLTGKKKKRSTRTHIAVIRFDITVPVDPKGKDVDILYSKVAHDLDAVFGLLTTKVNDGSFDILGLEIDKSSLTSSSIKLACDEGMEERLSTFSCVGCPTGQMYDSATKKCVFCPVGTFQDMDAQKECQACPSSYSTRNTGSKNISDCIALCSLGYHSIDGVEPCQSCERNTYQDQPGKTECIACPPGTNTSIQAASSVLNCTSDSDVCDGITCNNKGTCWDYKGSHTCTCSSGYTGDDCTIPPNPCADHLCQNGSQCVPSGTGYSCLCGVDNTGQFCQVIKVHGGWSNWGDFSSCSVSCGQGIQIRERFCINPPPSHEGQNCTGSDIDNQVCETNKECPSCTWFKRPYGVNVVYTKSNSAMNASLSCFTGKILQPSSPGLLSCSELTGYEWNPSLDTEELPKCVDFAAGTSLTLDNQISVTTSDNVANDIATKGKEIINDLSHTSSCVSSGKCKSRSVATTKAMKRKKRSTTYTIQITNTVVINFNFDDFYVNGVFQSAKANQSLEQYYAIIEDLEKLAVTMQHANENGTFNIIANGKTYSPVPSNFIQSGLVGCPSGKTSNLGLCANCAPGSYESNQLCHYCPIGTYQKLEGQTYCISCPAGYNMSRTGADSSTTCLTGTDTGNGSKVTNLSSSTTDSTTHQSGSKNMTGNENNTVTIAAAVISVSILALVVIVAAVWYCKKSGHPKRQPSRISIRPVEDNPPPYEAEMNKNEYTHFPGVITYDKNLPPISHKEVNDAFVKPKKIPDIKSA